MVTPLNDNEVKDISGGASAVEYGSLLAALTAIWQAIIAAICPP